MLWRTRVLPVLTATMLAAVGGTATAHAADPVPPVDGNPFLGARGYVNADWSVHAAAAAAEAGALGPAMATVARQPTAVWLDSIAAIAGVAGRNGLRGHLDAALAQQRAAGQPVVATFVLYNLPNRSCQRAPNGELTVAGGGAAAYRTGYVDPIAAILADPAYRDLRIAVVVEPDALGNEALAIASTWECAESRQGGVYLDTVPYALTRLHDIPNVYAYLDIVQSNALGWMDSFDAAVDIVAAAAARTPGGTASIDGFAVNVADYDPIVEPFLDIDAMVGGISIRQSRFVDWNRYLEERTYLGAMHAALVAEGFPSGIGMLVDTSRNGWGGPQRPTATSTSQVLDAYVDESKADRRWFRSTWCNQIGAGIGELPRAAPETHIDAYAWIKPPGESDGHYSGAPDRIGDIRCDPNSEMPPIGGSSRHTNAMPGAPPRGEWFPAAFAELVRNAHPPIPT